MFSGVSQAYLQDFYITATWFPPMLAERKFVELMFDDDNAAPTNSVRTQDLIVQFKHEVDALESRLSLCFELERLAGRKIQNEDGSSETQDQFLSHLWRCMSGREPARPPAEQSRLSRSNVRPGTPRRRDPEGGGLVPTGGGPRRFSPWSPIRTSSVSWPSCLASTGGAPGSSSWIPMRRCATWRNTARNGSRRSGGSSTSFPDELRADQPARPGHGGRHRRGADRTQRRHRLDGLLHERHRAFRCGSETIAATAQRVTKAINELGFNARVEDTNTLDAYFGSLPGHCDENVRRPLMNTLNLGDLMPTSSIWSGEPKAPCPSIPRCPRRSSAA